MRTNDRTINEEMFRAFHVIGLEVFPQLLPEASGFPAPEAIIHSIPVAKILRQVAPWDACPGHIQHCFDKHAITLLWRSPSLVLDLCQDGGDLGPCRICEHQSNACHLIPP